MLRCIVLILGCSVTSGLRLPSNVEDPEFSKEILIPQPEGLELDKYEDATDMQSPSGWLKKKSDAMPNFFQLHIPRTAGSSLSNTLGSQSWLPEGSGLYSQECCYGWLRGMMDTATGESHMVTIVREPVGHVYSMAVRGFGPGVNIHKYIDRWYAAVQKGKEPTEFYSPVNMQTRSFTCKKIGKDGNHIGPAGVLAEAIQNMDNTSFVLLQPHYKESLCIMHEKLHGVLPDHCDCRQKDLWATVLPAGDPKGHAKYQAPGEAKRNEILTEEDRLKIASFTKDDLALYEHALARFEQDVQTVEKKHNTKIWCH
eukprot:gnl/MRDRNA2_/MRDRNA2_86150_c0_seq2.p1 gnl/MRDRNA2_/MRDRNA2_86150_c0~~gnl/MRDRNA2_/MRDRNA2_86150_c0_seq2.p1  ORF type:complete len:312 (+),score=45.24 gnl/MRDRNA2_/MRDRNA2_86150_c0_seq2:75-1010(+)